MISLADLISLAKKTVQKHGKKLLKDGLHAIFSVGQSSGAKNVQGALYSAILDSRTCPYCKALDGLRIPINHPDFKSGQFHPPQHGSCRCMWIWIGKGEKGVVWNWDAERPNDKDLEEMQIAHYHGLNMASLAQAQEALKNAVKEHGYSIVSRIFSD